MIRHSQGVDAATLVIVNRNFAQIVQWQSHLNLRSFPENHVCAVCGEKHQEIQHLIKCYEGDLEYQNRAVALKVSLEYLMEGWSTVNHYTDWVNNY